MPLTIFLTASRSPNFFSIWTSTSTSDANIRINNDTDNNFAGWRLTVTLRDDGEPYPIKEVTPVTVIGIADWTGTLNFEIGGADYVVVVASGKGVLVWDFVVIVLA